MERKENKIKGQSVQFLFAMLLFLILTMCAVFTISFGAKVYQNIDSRMDENFIGTAALSYVSNKVKQSDESNAVSILKIEKTQVLKIQQVFDGTKYMTLIYFKNGNIKELFIREDTLFTLDDGNSIMEGSGLSFQMVEKNLLKVQTSGKNGDSIFLALRSEEDNNE